jgi:peptide methionine sulfoxide reductase MsrA
MKSMEFCYWLQGLFELEEPTSLNQKQTELIRSHLEMVFAYDKTPSNYCVFLNGFFKISKPTEIDASQTQVMKDYLNNIFEHVAAPVQTQFDVEQERRRNKTTTNRQHDIHSTRLMC